MANIGLRMKSDTDYHYVPGIKDLEGTPTQISQTIESMLIKGPEVFGPDFFNALIHSPTVPRHHASEPFTAEQIHIFNELVLFAELGAYEDDEGETFPLYVIWSFFDLDENPS